MKVKRLLGLMCVLIALVTVLAGCEASLPASSIGTVTPSSSLNAEKPSSSTGAAPIVNAPVLAGKLQINITDAPPKEEVEQVWLTIAGVKIHLAGIEAVPQQEQEQEQGNQNNQNQNQNQPEVNDGSLSLALMGDTRFNLLDYQGGLQAKLAMGDLAPGTYTQIIMDVTKVEIKIKGDDVLKEAKLPSNSLKFVHPFEIVGGQLTEIVLDFDALKSINVQGNGTYMCKPVIKLMTTKEPKATGGMEIAPPSLPNGGVGVEYDQTTLTASRGTGTYTWSISAGAIPTGLTFNTAVGTLSGTPTAAGEFTFTVKAEDSSVPVKSATRNYTVNIVAQGAIQITATNLPDGTEGTPYPAVMLKAIGVTGGYTWALAAGSTLPAGLSLTGDVISGTPTAKGNFSFTVQVSDSAGPPVNTDSQVITICINKSVTP
jgi:hypothetical protein